MGAYDKRHKFATGGQAMRLGVSDYRATTPLLS